MARLANSGGLEDRLRISALEADVAYFDAKLSLLREQRASPYREAQVKAYQELQTVLTAMLARLNSGAAAAAGGAVGHSQPVAAREGAPQEQPLDSTLDDLSEFNL